MYFCFSIGVGVDAWGFIARSIARYLIVDLFAQSIGDANNQQGPEAALREDPAVGALAAAARVIDDG